MKKKLKNSWKSLTIWLNGLALATIPLIDMARDSLPALGQYLTPSTLNKVGIAVIVLNIALRFRTNKPLEDK